MSKRLHAVFAVLLVLGLILSACGATEEPQAPPTDAPAATEAPAAEEPAEEEAVAEEEAAPAEEEAAVEDGVCVRIANYESSGEKMSQDPAILYSGGDAPYVYAIYERLVDVTPNFEVIPELAESWESNEDATEWTFHLREGVKFHDGSDFDANDVVYTYQRILDPELGSSGYAILSPILTPDSIVAVDDQTVVFKTEESAVTLPTILTTKETGIVPEGAAAADLAMHGVGTGPYMYESFEPGNDYVKLAANPDYWQAGMPKAACLEIRTIQEATTAAAALQGGDLDVVLQVDSAVLPSLQDDASINLVETAAGNSMTFSMFTDTPPYDDIKVREALKKVIDRDQMVQTVLLGFGEPGADNPIPITDPLSYLHGQEAPAQDIEGAVALLAEAGYDESNPLTIDLYTSEAIPGHTRMSQVFAEQAAEAGIVINVIQTPADTFWDDVWLTQDFVTSAWSRRPVIVAEGMAYTCESQYPETHWCRPEFDETMSAAASTLDPDAQLELLHEMQTMIAEDGGVIIPMFVHAVAGMRAECSGWEPHVQNFNNDWSQIGCGEMGEAAPAPTEAPAEEEAAPAEEEAAVEDGVCVRIANYESSGEKMSQDPAILYSGGDAPYVYAIYERLVDVTPNFEVIPELAESWESNEDATEWTFHLREGVKFHDGSDFDANDVVYTYQRILDPELGSSGYAILSPILTPDSIVAVDDQTVVFKTEESAVTLPTILTTKETGIVPEGAAAADLAMHGVGTGPYMYESFEPGNDYVKLAANPDYWQAGMPKAACLEIRTIQEATTAAAALQGGDLDVVLQVDSAVLPSLQDDASINLVETAAGNSMTFSMFTDTPPYDDIKVREALKKVIDRDQMVQTVLLGFGEPGADNPIPITDPLSYLHGQEAPAQDIEGAVALLAEAGYDESNPLTIDLYTSEAIPGHTRMSQVFAEQAAEAGIVINVIQTPADTFWDDVWLTQDFVTSAWSRRPVIVAEGMAYTCESQYPETHWCRPEFDETMSAAASTLDPDAQLELLHEMQTMIAEDGGVIIPMFVHAVAGMRAECSGWEPHVQNFNNDWSQIGCER